MLLESNQVDLGKFMKEFEARFASFCDNAPIILTFSVTPVNVILQDSKTKEVKEFPFDYTLSVKDNIHTIKEWLIANKYPQMLEVKSIYRARTDEEKQEMIDKGYSPEAVTSKATTIVKTRYRIEKLFVKKDILFVRNLTTKEEARYQLNMPSSIFLKKWREELNEEEMFELFKETSTHLNDITSDFGKNPRS